MLSVIVLCSDASPAIAVVRTLAALVPGVVRGTVRDLTLAAPGTALFARIADEAGCIFAGSADLGQALMLARQDWLLLVQAGFAPGDGFWDEAEDFCVRGTCAGVLRTLPDTLWTRLIPQAAPAAGLLLNQAMLKAAGAMEFQRLVQAVRPRRTLVSRARAVA